MAYGLAAASMAAAIAPLAAADEPVEVSVPAQRLDLALIELARQANISISLPANGIEAARSNPVGGKLMPGQALEQALEGTKFQAERVSPKAWKIVPVAAWDTPDPVWHPPKPIRLVEKPDTAGGLIADELETVLVVSKRSEQLSQIARSVSIVGADQLATLGATSLPDIAGDAGTIQFSNVGSGRNKAFVRGVSDGALAGRAQSTTGLYLSDARLTFAAPDPDLRLSDIESVSILSGPQGALYGAGSIGGIIRIQPNPVDLRQVTLDTAASVELTGDRSIGSALDLVANIPIVKDRFGLRLVAYDQTTGGWIDHRNLGIEDANKARRLGGRLTATWIASARTNVTFQGVAQDIDVDDSQYLIRKGEDAFRPSILEPHDNDFHLASGTIESETDLGTLKSTLSLVSHRTYSRYDATGLFDSLVSDTTVARPIDEDDKLFFVTNETRLASPASAPVPWFVGVFLSQGRTDRDVYVRDGLFGEWRDTVYEEDRRDRISEYALFGEAIWSFGDNLTLTTGARTFAYDVSVKARTDAASDNVTENYSGRLKKVGLAPDIRLKWQAAPQILVYVSAAEGYRSPGFNTGGFVELTPPGDTQPNRIFLGDELWTYELGTRVVAPDSRWMLAATLFRNEWRDIQTDEFLSNDFAFTGNAGDSSSNGVEFHATYEPDEHWLFRLNAMINEPEIVRPDPNFPIGSDAVLSGATEWSGSLSMGYRKDGRLFGHSGTASFSLSGDFVGPSSLQFGTGAKIGSRSEFLLNAGFQTTSWKFRAYVKNLFDAAGPSFSNGNPYQADEWEMTTPIRPRTIGISVSRSIR